MKFSWTGEVSARVGRRYLRVGKYLEESFRREQASSPLASSEVEISFCPIIMDATLRQYYPARSEVDLKEGVVYCAPQLDYDLFVRGDFSEQVGHCLDELGASERYLRKLGMDADEIAELQAIFERMRVTE